jgi:hypothetical protein
MECNIPVYCDTYLTNKTRSSSDDWIYYQLGYTFTRNYTQIQAVQCYISFTPITVHRCTRTRILSPLVVSQQRISTRKL